MRPENRFFLETNRHHLQTMKAGFIKGLQIDRMRQVMLEEFNPHYGPVDKYMIDSVFRMVSDIYAAFDKFLLEPEIPEEKDVPRFGDAKMPELKFPDNR
jgi:hypothetical protein